MKKILLFLTLLVSTLVIGQQTAIPDSNFEQALIDLGYDSGTPDGFVPTANINTITTLEIINENILDLTGIEDFENLEYLDCKFNGLTNLDMSQNSALTYLDCFRNQLTNIDVSQNMLLNDLRCGSNQLSNLDVSQNTALTNLSCRQNLLTSLNTSSNPNLMQLGCYNNQISNLDVTQNTDLLLLLCSNNQLTTLDISQNTALTEIECGANPLTTLDFSLNTALTSITCQSNELTSLNVKNGNNGNMTLWAAGNPNLTCIQVDDEAFSTANWTYIDQQTSFSEDCNYIVDLTYVPDDNFEQALIDLGYDSGSLDDYVPTNNINTITSLDVSQENITDLTGIEDFTTLDTLNCSNNDLINLDVSQNTVLVSLECNHNDLTNLNVNQNTTLTILRCNNNDINSLDLSQNTALTSLDCSNNNLTSLDVSHNTALRSLEVNLNSLNSLDVSLNTELNGLTCIGNQIPQLDVSQNTSLVTLACNGNQLTNLDVSQNTLLEILWCNVNQLTHLDLSNNVAINILVCSTNQLTSLNLQNGNNSAMGPNPIEVRDNPNLTCIQVDDEAFSTANWTYIDPQTSFSENCTATAEINDTCADATAITVEVDTPNTVTLNNALATQSIQSSCDNNNDLYPDVWFSFTMPIDGNLRITGVDGIDRFTLYENCGGGEIKCFQSPNFFYNINAGDYILRYATLDIFAGEESFIIQAFNITTNDDCENAETIIVETASPTLVNLNNAMATESTETSCDTIDDDYLDVWYSFTMPIDGNLRVTEIDDIDRITIYENTCSGPEVKCFTGANFAYNLDAGEYILRYATTDEHAGPETFAIQAFEIATNDECTNAQTISIDTPTTTLVSLNNAMATESLRASCDTLDDDYLDLWYEFTLQEERNLEIVNIDGTDRITIYEDSCSGDEIACFTSINTVENLPAGNYILRYATFDFFAGPRGFSASSTETLNTETATTGLKTSIFPTITDGIIYIKFNKNPENIKIQITDVNGREVYNTWHKNETSQTLELNLSKFSKGLYFITFSNATVFQTKKIILK